MSDNLGCARAREAVQWLATYDPEDGHGGPVGEESAANQDSLFTQSVVVAAFCAGAEAADVDFTFERQTGQGQLDDATALMTEAAEQFRSYEAHHRTQAGYPDADTATQWVSDRGKLADIKDRLAKAERNALMAMRLEAWLDGKSFYPVNLNGGAETLVTSLIPINPAEAFRAAVFPPDDEQVPDEVVDQRLRRYGPGPGEDTVVADGEQVVIEDGGIERHYSSRGDAHPFGDSRCGLSNVRPVTSGPLADAAVVDDVLQLVGAVPARSVLSVGGMGLFRLVTSDPRFDPAKPVTVNGYAFNPATED